MKSRSSRPLFTDEADDVDVGDGVAGDHAEQCRLTAAGSGEDADALSEACGEDAVDGADAYGDGFADPFRFRGSGGAWMTGIDFGEF